MRTTPHPPTYPRHPEPLFTGQGAFGSPNGDRFHGQTLGRAVHFLMKTSGGRPWAHTPPVSLFLPSVWKTSPVLISLHDVNTHEMPILLVVAAPLEATAIIRAFPAPPMPPALRDWTVARLSARFRLVVTGIGKVNAAGAVSRAMERGSYRAVINLGIAGTLPGSNLDFGQAVLASTSVFADEGIATPDGFQTCSQMGFPLGPFEGNVVPADPALLGLLTPTILARQGRIGAIATVSTCSGTDVLASSVATRTGAIAEAMEGAAIGQVAARFSDRFPNRRTPFAEVRAVSNTTGDRPTQKWEIKRALAALTELTAALPAVFDW
jgi:futalosine hydrolase